MLCTVPAIRASDCCNCCYKFCLCLTSARLKILKEVAHRGSFSAAADALSYTQSAVSQQIAALEAEDGHDAAQRHPRGVSLTAAGQTLVGHAEGILARLESAEAALAAIAGLRGGRLRMASFPTAGATLMPLAIATFRARYPDVELTLAEGEPEQIAPRLRAGELDLALLFEFGGSPPRTRSHGSSCSRIRCSWLCLAITRWPVSTSSVWRISARKPGCRPRAPAPARATSCAAATPPASSRTCLIRERRLPDRAGPGGGRRRCRADPRAGADGGARGHRDPRPLPRPPVRQVIAATPAGARLLPAAPAMLRCSRRQPPSTRRSHRAARYRPQRRKSMSSPSAHPDAPVPSPVRDACHFCWPPQPRWKVTTLCCYCSEF